MPGHTGIRRGPRRDRQLALPDHVAAAVGGHIDRDVPEARSAGVVGSRPGHERVVAAAERCCRQGRGGRHRVCDLRDRRRRLRPLRVHHHARRGRNAGPGCQARQQLRRPAYGAAAGALPVVGRQQPAGAALQHLAGQGIDGLDQPGCGRRLLIQVDARRDPEDEATRRAEVDVLGEEALPGGHVDGDVADLDRAQPERGGVEGGIQLGDDLHLIDQGGGAGVVLERDRVG